MKNKILIDLVITSLIIVSINCYNIKSLYAEENLIELDEEQTMDMVVPESTVKVNFYRWDRKTDQRQEFIGTAELEGEKLTFDITDTRLEKMLKNDFHTMITVEEDGRKINKLMVYKVGTIEHLKKVIENCKDISCIAEFIIE